MVQPGSACLPCFPPERVRAARARHTPICDACPAGAGVQCAKCARAAVLRLRHIQRSHRLTGVRRLNAGRVRDPVGIEGLVNSGAASGLHVVGHDQVGLVARQAVDSASTAAELHGPLWVAGCVVLHCTGRCGHAVAVPVCSARPYSRGCPARCGREVCALHVVRSRCLLRPRPVGLPERLLRVSANPDDGCASMRVLQMRVH